MADYLTGDVIERPNFPAIFARLGADRLATANAAIYLTATWQAGLPIWKCAVLTVAVFLAMRIHYGRSVISRLGVVLLVLLILSCIEVLPPLSELRADLSNGVRSLREK